MNLQRRLLGTEPLTQHHILALRVTMGIIFINHGGLELFDSKAMYNFVNWLQKDLHFPQPLLMAYLRTDAEFFGGILCLRSVSSLNNWRITQKYSLCPLFILKLTITFNLSILMLIYQFIIN